MRRPKIVRFLLLAPFILFIFLFVFGQAVLHLWNWLMPTLFGLPAITFWQAWGLMALSWILFGGFRGFGGPARPLRRGRGEHWDRWQRWQEMTPEERTALREALNRRCGDRPADPATDPADA
jgi:hypothetical protein